MDKIKLHNEIGFGSAARRPTRHLVRKVAALALGLAIASSVLALDETQVPANAKSNTSLPDAPLLVFSGLTGTLGMDAHHTDHLVFADGNFHSKQCEKLGFESSGFNIERDGESLRFSAINVSPKHGTLTWNGVIRGGVIQAHYRWKKERLFWTIEREYWFSGEANDVRY